jgi:hypothetical protein
MASYLAYALFITLACIGSLAILGFAIEAYEKRSK